MIEEVAEIPTEVARQRDSAQVDGGGWQFAIAAGRCCQRRVVDIS